MRFFVFGTDGQKYGPADMYLLAQWAAEGRIMPYTVLEAEGSGKRTVASTVPGLTFVSTPTLPVGPMPSPYGGSTHPHTSAYPGSMKDPLLQDPLRSASSFCFIPADLKRDFNLSIILSAAQFFLGCLPISIAGLVMAYIVKRKGHPKADWAIFLGWAALAVYVLGQLGVDLLPWW